MTHTLWITLLLVLPGSVLAADTPASLATLIEQLIGQKQISDVQISPDGQRTAVVVRGLSSDGKTRSNIWLFDEQSGRVRELTSPESDNESPRWAPDGSELAFLSSVDEAPSQVYLIRPNDGEARRLTNVAGGVLSFQWSPTHDYIAFSTTDPKPDAGESKEQEPDVVIGSEKYPPARLMLANAASGEVRRIIADDRWAIGEFAWLPDGKRLVVAAVDDFLPVRAIDRVFIASLDTGELRPVGRIDSVEFGKWQVSPEGDLLAYVGSSNGPTLHDLFLMPLDSGEAINLTGAGTEANIDRPVDHISWINAEEIAFVTADGFGSTIRTVDTRGRATILQRFPSASVSALDAAHGKLLYAKSSAVTPAELWRSMDGSETRVTNLHPDFPELIAPRTIQYPSSENLEIEAMVYYPEQPLEPAPTVALIHGGPTGRFSNSINNWAQVLAESGYVVFAPNIRGSIGYGEAFMMSNRAGWGAGDFEDVMAGIDYLVGKGVADSERLAIAGWSYGGFMSAWATTQTQRFKAAVVGAAMLDLNVQWGAELPVIVPYDTWYLGTPWDQPENFRRMSPISHVENVVTPTLLMVGAQDSVDHPVQNWLYFRALRMLGVPAELVVYPREGHSILEETHARDVLVRLVDWVNKYLK